MESEAIRTARRLQMAHNARSGKGRPLTKGEFWAALTAEEREPLQELAEAFGPLEYEDGWEIGG